MVRALQNTTGLCSFEVSGSERGIRVETLGTLHDFVITLRAHGGWSEY
jgi:hypothetical protein